MAKWHDKAHGLARKADGQSSTLYGHRLGYQSETLHECADELSTLLAARPQPAPENGTSDGSPDDIVGHKTFDTGRISPSGFPELRHEPLTRREAEAVIAHVEQEREQRASHMPDERSAITALFDAWQRLKELGWQEAQYCPKDGSIFLAIEAGSLGIHECSYQGEWPKGHWYVHNIGDLWPSRPILFKAKAVGEPPAPSEPPTRRVDMQERVIDGERRFVDASAEPSQEPER